MKLRSSVVRWAVVGWGAFAAVGGFACGPTGGGEPEASLATRGQSLITTTGSMATARAGHVAVLLQDGSVLVTGGWTASGSLSSMTASAERYVPATGTWSATGSMGVKRERHVAVRLPNGQVLVAAGLGLGTAYLSSAELYDPATGTWSATGSLSVGRTNPSLSLLQDGRALLVGGSGSSVGTSVEVYDPATGTWSATGSLLTARSSHTATVLPSGKVLVVGGGSSSGPLASAELYDPTTGTWSSAGSLTSARASHSAHLLPNGRVLIVGGYGSSSSPLMAELYDPSAGTWTQASQFNVAHYQGAGVSLADGSVLVAGGSTGTVEPRIERYNLATGAWATVDNLLTPRAFETGTLLGNGQVLLVGGNYGGPLASAELYTDVASSDTTPPTVQITSPTNGATVSGVVTLSANASDNVGVTRVEFFRDGVLFGTDSTAPYSLGWITSSGPNGSYVLTSKAYDAAGNVATSAAVSVTVNNDTTPPTVQLTSPTSGATVSGTITLGANASDNVGVTRVEFYRGSTLLGTDSTAPYSLPWSSTSVANGGYVLTSKAYDAAGNVATSAGVSITVSNAGTGSALFAAYDATLKAPRCSSVGSSCDTGTLVNGRASLGPELNQPNTLQGSACADGTAGGYHSDESLDALKVATLDGTAFAPGKTVKVEARVWAWSGSGDVLDLYSTVDVNNPTWVYLTTVAATTAGAQTLTATYTLPTGTLQALRGVFRYGGSASPCGSTSGYDDRDDLVFAVGN